MRSRRIRAICGRTSPGTTSNACRQPTLWTRPLRPGNSSTSHRSVSRSEIPDLPARIVTAAALLRRQAGPSASRRAASHQLPATFVPSRSTTSISSVAQSLLFPVILIPNACRVLFRLRGFVFAKLKKTYSAHTTPLLAPPVAERFRRSRNPPPTSHSPPPPSQPPDNLNLTCLITSCS
jgi:hypothetical protein